MALSEFVVLAPHPDDESLGCGGVIAAACARGCSPDVVFVTDGAASHPGSAGYPPDRLRRVRAAEARAACTILGVPEDRVHFLGLPDSQAPQAGPAFDTAADRIAGLVRRRGARTVCATWRHDPHCDHVAVHLLAMAVARQTGAAVLSYPVWGWTLPADRTPARVEGTRIDISAQLAVKRRAIAAHASQVSELITDDPHGFRLPAAFLAWFDRPYEVFLQPA